MDTYVHVCKSHQIYTHVFMSQTLAKLLNYAIRILNNVNNVTIEYFHDFKNFYEVHHQYFTFSVH